MPGVRIEIAGRFVGQQQGRPVDQRPGDGDPLLLAARHLRRLVVHAIGQADPFEERLGQFTRPATGRPGHGVVQRHEHVVKRRRPRQQVEALEDEAQLGGPHQRPFVGRKAAHFLAVEPEAARAWPVEAAQDVHERGLAGARGTHQGDHFAAVDRERDALQHRHVHFAEVVGLGDIFQVDQPAGDVGFGMPLRGMAGFRTQLGKDWRAEGVHGRQFPFGVAARDKPMVPSPGQACGRATAKIVAVWAGMTMDKGMAGGSHLHTDTARQFSHGNLKTLQEAALAVATHSSCTRDSSRGSRPGISAWISRSSA